MKFNKILFFSVVQVMKKMEGVTKGLDKAMASMDLEQVTIIRCSQHQMFIIDSWSLDKITIGNLSTSPQAAFSTILQAAFSSMSSQAAFSTILQAAFSSMSSQAAFSSTSLQAAFSLSPKAAFSTIPQAAFSSTSLPRQPPHS